MAGKKLEVKFEDTEFEVNIRQSANQSYEFGNYTFGNFRIISNNIIVLNEQPVNLTMKPLQVRFDDTNRTYGEFNPTVHVDSSPVGEYPVSLSISPRPLQVRINESTRIYGDGVK